MVYKLHSLDESVYMLGRLFSLFQYSTCREQTFQCLVWPFFSDTHANSSDFELECCRPGFWHWKQTPMLKPWLTPNPEIPIRKYACLNIQRIHLYKCLWRIGNSALAPICYNMWLRDRFWVTVFLLSKQLDTISKCDSQKHISIKHLGTLSKVKLIL